MSQTTPETGKTEQSAFFAWNAFETARRMRFDYASKFGIRYHDLPEDADASFFLCKELMKNCRGRFLGDLI